MTNGQFTMMLARAQFAARTRERCWTRLSRQLALTRLPLEYCFRQLEERARRDRSLLARVYADIARRLAGGLSVGEAIAPYAGPEEVMLIDAGQRSGERGLAEGFRLAAQCMARHRAMRSAVVRELLYPASLMAAMCACLIVISTVLVPRLAILANPATWQGAGAMLYKVSLFVSSAAGLVSLLGLLAAGLLVVCSLPRLTGRLRRWADHVPPWSVYRLLTGVSWLYATALLLQTRQQLGVILRRLILARETSPYLRWRLLPIVEADSQGLSLGDALCSTPDRWPDREMAEDIRVYSALPGFSDMLTELAEHLMTDAMERVQRLAKMLGGVAILIVIVLMLLLVTGLFGIQEQITSSVGRMGNL